MLKNMEQAQQLYTGWQVLVYHDDTVSPAIIKELKERSAITIDMTGGIYGMFWRLYAADMKDCEYVIFRDADSRLSKREQLAVDEWVNSGNIIHIMRDHPYHKADDGNLFYILGGMWGIKGGAVDMRQMIDDYAINHQLTYGSDQLFLNEIYHRFKHRVTVHDEFFEKKPFPVKRNGLSFIGEKINEDEQPFDDARLVIKNYQTNNYLNRVKQLIYKLLHKNK